MGAFGAAAVVKGPESVAKLTDGIRPWVVGLIVAGAVALLASILATARAQRGPTAHYRPLTGLRLAKWNLDESRRADKALSIGKASGIAAAVFVLGAGVLATLSEAAPADPPRPSFLVRTTDGAVECGVLGRATGRLVLQDADGEALLRLEGGVAAIETVRACPSTE
jgi:hypothetical protein